MDDEQDTNQTRRAFYIMQAFQIALLLLVGSIAFLAHAHYGFGFLRILGWICVALLGVEFLQLVAVWYKPPW